MGQKKSGEPCCDLMGIEQVECRPLYCIEVGREGADHDNNL